MGTASIKWNHNPRSTQTSTANPSVPYRTGPFKSWEHSD